MIKKIIKDEYTNIRGATLICGYHTLSKIQSYLRQLTYVYTSQNTRLHHTEKLTEHKPIPER